MTDYWKSNAKKFCEICKVWFADNRISIENHERGLKHKGMLQKHLREMGQRAKEKEFQQGHLNATLISMEQAALAAMRRDGHKISAVPQSVHHEAPSVTVQHPPSKEYEQVQKIIDRQKEKLESKKKRSSDGKPKTEGPTFMQKVEAQREFEKYKKKTENKSRWDVRKMVSSDVVPTAPPVEDPNTSNKDLLRYVEQPVSSSGLGPWIPVEKKPPSAAELQAWDSKKIKLDDLPEQEPAYNNQLLFDEDEHDIETDFKERVVPVTSSNSKKSKPVFFRKPKSKGAATVKQESNES